MPAFPMEPAAIQSWSNMAFIRLHSLSSDQSMCVESSLFMHENAMRYVSRLPYAHSIFDQNKFWKWKNKF